MEHLDDLLRGTVSLEQPEAQATACEGLAKLMLAGKVTNPTLLQTLILVYFSLESTDNQPLRQCLSYFLPVYCYSSPTHQRSLLSVRRTFPTFRLASSERSDGRAMLTIK